MPIILKNTKTTGMVLISVYKNVINLSYRVTSPRLCIFVAWDNGK